MRPSYDSATPFLLPFLLPVICGLTFDCSKIPVKGHKYDFSPLSGPHYVNQIEEEEGISGYHNTTYTVDLCEKLPVNDKVPDGYECKELGTRICGIRRYYQKDKSVEVEKAIEIAGEYALSNGRALNPGWTPLKDSPSSDDMDKDGVRVELHGGKDFVDEKNGRPQKAIIEFLCDHGRTGNEDVDGDPDKGTEDEDGDENNSKSENSETRFDKVSEKVQLDGTFRDGDSVISVRSNRSLQFISYRLENDDKIGVLRLKWRTKQACKVLEEEPSEIGERWGLFTWFIIIVFLGASSYLIFGAWLNYNRYGARGWDLVPHGDTIRDIPYVVKDWARSATNAMQGPGSRGGYSAV